MAGWKLYVCVLVVVVIASGAAALECYECSLCDDPFDSSDARKTECSGSCAIGKGNGAASRYCVPDITQDTCETVNEGEVCLCTSNLCNSAPIHGISILGLISITIATLLWKS